MLLHCSFSSRSPGAWAKVCHDVTDGEAAEHNQREFADPGGSMSTL